MKRILQVSFFILLLASNGSTACAKLPLDTFVLAPAIDTTKIRTPDNPDSITVNDTILVEKDTIPVSSPIFNDTLTIINDTIPIIKDTIPAGNDSIPTLNEMPETLTVMQWNIGHFSMGKSKNSNVTDVVFDSRSFLFKELLEKVNADFISLNEYSTLFSNTNKHPECRADTLLFSSYSEHYFGNNGIQRNYSYNAVFSNTTVSDAKTIEYEVNKNARITHTNLIKATDYYYIRAEFNWRDERIVFISTHLAFDKNNKSIAINQVEELLSLLEKETHVIICGDFNCLPEEYAFIISEKGFCMANGGDICTYPATNPSQALDNIIVKGLHISEPRILSTFLSDHLPIICDISLIAN